MYKRTNSQPSYKTAIVSLSYVNLEMVGGRILKRKWEKRTMVRMKRKRRRRRKKKRKKKMTKMRRRGRKKRKCFHETLLR